MPVMMKKLPISLKAETMVGCVDIPIANYCDFHQVRCILEIEIKRQLICLLMGLSHIDFGTKLKGNIPLKSL